MTPTSGSSPDEMALITATAAELGVDRDARTVHRVTIPTGAHQLSALRWGDPAGAAALVLLHGGSLNAHAWDKMLLLHGHMDALAVDLPGHGYSSWFDDPLYLPVDLADVLAPALESAARPPVTLVGHSLGGLTALALAAGRPDLVRALVLVDATPGSTPDRSSDIVEFASVTDFASFDEMLDHAAGFKPHRSRESLRRSVLLNARQDAEGRWAWRHDQRRLEGADRWQIIFEELGAGWTHAAEVRCPTLLVRGERSPIVLESDVVRYRSLVADLEVVTIAGAGHNIQGERPQALGEAITAFLSRLGG